MLIASSSQFVCGVSAAFCVDEIMNAGAMAEARGSVLLGAGRLGRAGRRRTLGQALRRAPEAIRRLARRLGGLHVALSTGSRLGAAPEAGDQER